MVPGAIVANRQKVHVDLGVGEECLFCGQAETLAHLFVQCPRLSALFGQLRRWFQGFGEGFSFGLFIFGPKYFAKKRSADNVMNFLSASAKLAIWLTRKNQAQNGGSVEPVVVLEGLLRARLRVEHAYYRTTDNMRVVAQLWTVGRVLCSVGKQEHLTDGRVFFVIVVHQVLQ